MAAARKGGGALALLLGGPKGEDDGDAEAVAEHALGQALIDAIESKDAEAVETAIRDLTGGGEAEESDDELEM